jgi:hypothetical protein
MLLVLSVVVWLLAMGESREPMWVTPGSLAIVLLVGGFVLSMRSLLVLHLVVGAGLIWMAVGGGSDEFVKGGAFVVVATGIIVLLFAPTRSRLGLQGIRGEAMLVDLRDRLRAQGEMPPLPPVWHAEVVLRSAYGASFSGDFLVATRSPSGRHLEVVLVDVSGKGVDAGTRALMLSGAFGGLLGAMPPEEFLLAANAYLIRQKWDEGFATAAHFVVDLDSGDFAVALAGHPSPAQFHAGSGRWRLVEVAEGPLLGVLPDARFPAQAGTLARGDALVLYTDGLIETPGRDLSAGIDRLLGEADRLVTRGFRHGARKLVDWVGAGENDDRALILLWRT